MLCPGKDRAYNPGLLGGEAPLATPDGVDFSFSFLNRACCVLQVHTLEPSTADTQTALARETTPVLQTIQAAESTVG